MADLTDGPEGTGADGGDPAQDRDTPDSPDTADTADTPDTADAADAAPETAGASDPSGAAAWAPGRHVVPTRRRSPVAVVAFTVLGAIIPGSGLIAAGRVRTGITVLVVAVAAAVAFVLYVGTDLSSVLSRALDERALRRGAIAAIVVAVAWCAVTVISHRALRPRTAGIGERVGGSVLVGVLCLGIATPLVLGANVLLTTRQTLSTVFASGNDNGGLGDDPGAATPTSSSAPTASSSPTATKVAGYAWPQRRLNILLLGSDAGNDRTGTRTDSMVIASIDTVTGKMILLSVPRNLCRLDWNPDQPLGQLYPNGWTVSGGDCDGSGASGDDLINAIYNDVPIDHPGVVGTTDNPGAKALAEGLQYSLGVRIGYYLLVDLSAFQQIVDAIGGVTVNINTPIPVGGQHDAATGLIITQYPSRWLMPGPNQHLDGKNALWYARGRFASDDYARIDRQKCMINAITTQANPTKVLTSYASLATTLQNDVLTDIPESLLNPLAQLALKIKAVHQISSLTIDPTSIPAMGSSDYPDWTGARAAVAEAIASTDPSTSSSTSPSASPSTAAASPTPSAAATTTPATPTANPSITATTSNGSNVTTNVGAGCAYDPAAAKTNIAEWQSQYGSMYDSTGHRR